MANQATINPTPDQQVFRSIGRVKTLKAAIAQAEAKGSTEKAEALREELTRRMATLIALREEIEGL